MIHNRELKNYYFIDDFNKDHIRSLNKNISIIYRNYSEKYNQEKILEIKKLCKKINKKFFFANDVNLTDKLNLDGAYIPAFNKDTHHLSYSIRPNFHIVGSAHNLNEIKTKELQNVKKIFLSSLFKKNKNFLGINRFKLLSNLTKKKIVMLGGISKKNLKYLSILNTKDFAGITYFE